MSDSRFVIFAANTLIFFRINSSFISALAAIMFVGAKKTKTKFVVFLEK